MPSRRWITCLPDGVDIVVDAGNTGAAAIHQLPVRRAGRFVVALGMGGMGYSFGAGIGMASAGRRRTVVIAGDGSFFMHGMEIAHRDAVPAAGHRSCCSTTTRTPCASPVNNCSTAIVQLQPVPAEPFGRGPGGDVPGPACRRRRPHRRNCAARCGRALSVDGPVGGQCRMLRRRNPTVRTVSD